MKQANLIKINNFQIDNDGDLLLISKVDKFPFLAVNEKGVAFDAGPFTGAFCSLESLAKFIVKGQRNAACYVHLKFAEGDVYPMGEFYFSEEQYSEALRWVIKANKRIEEKKEAGKENSSPLAKAVVSMIANCLEKDEQLLEFSTAISENLDSLRSQELVLATEKRFPIVVQDGFFARIRTIADVIDYVNAQVEDEKVFLGRRSGQPEK